MQRISVAVMGRNEAKPLARILPQLPKCLSGMPVDSVLYNDGSTDESVEVAAGNGVKVIDFRSPLGLSRAIRLGIQHALESDHLYHIHMDGDGQHDPVYLSQVVGCLEAGADLVVSSRFHPKSPRRGELPLDRYLLNITITAAFNRITGLGFSDPLCGLRGYRREVMEFLLEQEFATDQCADSLGFILESLLRVWHSGRFRIVETPHPAIYVGEGKLEYIYQTGYLEERLERFKIHARHLVLVMQALNLHFLE